MSRKDSTNMVETPREFTVDNAIIPANATVEEIAKALASKYYYDHQLYLEGAVCCGDILITKGQDDGCPRSESWDFWTVSNAKHISSIRHHQYLDIIDWNAYANVPADVINKILKR